MVKSNRVIPTVNMIDILLLPFLAGLGVSIVSGPLGAFVVWRRMAYFGDTLAHSGLLGVGLSLIISVNTGASIIFVSCAVAICLVLLEKKSRISTDVLLGILSHSTLALGLICISLFSNRAVNVQALLFGDLLLVSSSDVLMIYGCSIIVLCTILLNWKKLVLVAVDEDLAKVEGFNVDLLRLILMLLIATVIAISIKVVGVLLITALLIIPAATSRLWTSSPESMAGVATLLSNLCLMIGLGMSYFFDFPAGPSIVLACSSLFLFSRLASKS